MISNSERYDFAGFTRAEYRRLIKLAKEKFIFRSYTNFNENERFILWRHDIDSSMHSACKIAQIEHEEGIKATYFVHLHSDFYNVWEPEIFKLLHKIIELGHDVGLHFDAHFYNIERLDDLNKYIEYEKVFLENLINQKIEAFSFHRPTSFTLQCEELQYGGLINVYSKYFKQQVPYCSDSSGYWRFRRLEDCLLDSTLPRFHVLTHAEWWTDEVMSPLNRIKRCITGRANKTLSTYNSDLESYGSNNVDD